jgi:S1-C subfamily serine protease
MNWGWVTSQGHPSFRTAYVAGWLALACPTASALTPEEITAKGRPATVFIAIEAESTAGAHLRPSGTGFVVNSHGYVLTSKHLLPTNTKDAPRIRVALQSRFGQLEDMELIATDPNFDFALLKFSNTAMARPFVTIGNPWITPLTAPLQALGFPLNIEFSSKTGTLVGLGGPGGAWVTDIALNPGDSGGPVLNRDGKVVAMVVSALPQAEGIKFALPITFSSYLLKLVGLEQLASFTETPEVVRYAVSRTRDTTHGLTPTSGEYTLEVKAREGFVITQVELSRKSDSKLSDVDLKVIDGGEKAVLKYRLTSGPVYDQYRGWLEGDIITQQKRRTDK